MPWLIWLPNIKTWPNLDKKKWKLKKWNLFHFSVHSSSEIVLYFVCSLTKQQTHFTIWWNILCESVISLKLEQLFLLLLLLCSCTISCNLTWQFPHLRRSWIKIDDKQTHEIRNGFSLYLLSRRLNFVLRLWHFTSFRWILFVRQSFEKNFRHRDCDESWLVEETGTIKSKRKKWNFCDYLNYCVSIPPSHCARAFCLPNICLFLFAVANSTNRSNEFA